MQLRVAQLDRCDAAGARRQRHRALRADRDRRGLRVELLQCCVDVGDHDGDVLEPGVVAGVHGRIGRARLVELHDLDALRAERQRHHQRLAAGHSVGGRVHPLARGLREAETIHVEGGQRVRVRAGQADPGQRQGCQGHCNTSTVEKDRVYLVPSADEQTAARATAESQVRDDFRGQDLAEQPAAGIDAVHPVGGAAPEIAVLVDTEPVAVARLDLVEDVAAGEPPAVRGEREDADILFRIRFRLVAGLGDVEQALVWREGEPVRPVEIAGDDAHLAAQRVEPIDRRRLARRSGGRPRSR